MIDLIKYGFVKIVASDYFRFKNSNLFVAVSQASDKIAYCFWRNITGSGIPDVIVESIFLDNEDEFEFMLSHCGTLRKIVLGLSYSPTDK